MYAKLFPEILDSSLAQDYEVRHVFMDLLVLADRDGIVDMTAEAIARRTNVPLDKLLTALTALTLPDRNSRTPDEDGKRIVLLDPHRNWGWRIVNYCAYANIKDENAKRERNRRCQQAHRDRKRGVIDVSADKRESAPIAIPTTTSTDSSPAPPADDIGKPDQLPNLGKTKRNRKGTISKPGTPNPFADAYKAAFDRVNPEAGYTWHKGDFPQLVTWRAAYPDVTPARFGEVATGLLGLGQYRPGYAATIQALCANWPQAVLRLNGHTGQTTVPDQQLLDLAADAARIAAGDPSRCPPPAAAPQPVVTRPRTTGTATPPAASETPGSTALTGAASRMDQPPIAPEPDCPEPPPTEEEAQQALAAQDDSQTSWQ